MLGVDCDNGGVETDILWVILFGSDSTNLF
jgi:hypothetical protein